MSLRKKTCAPTTTIRLFPQEKQLIRVAAALCNERYQVYMKRVILENAAMILESHGNGAIRIYTSNERKITFIDD